MSAGIGNFDFCALPPHLRIAGAASRMLMGSMRTLILIAATLAMVANSRVRAENQIDFVRDIQPILQKSCLKCHGAEKPKGQLRLNAQAAALKGGENGAVIVPGQADKSDLYRRITLPADNDDVMPSKGDLLTKAQTDLIRDWINQGAVWPAGVVIASETKETEAPTVAAPGSPLPDYKPTAAELKAIKELESLGVAIRPIAANMNWREANFRGLAQDPAAVAKALVPLRKVLGVIELNLAGAQFKDADLSNIESLNNLRRLHLENTPITDAGLVHLKGLAMLEYLNLYGTAVTDAGLANLEGLKKLKKVYLWESKVTDEGAKKLAAAVPGIQIVRGIVEAKAVEVKPEEKKAEEKKPEEKKPEEKKN